MKMKKPLTALAAIVFAGSIGGVAIAQDAPGYNHDISQTEVANFSRFLDSHPADAGRLAADPSLINRPDFVEDHPGLHEFLENHPGVREEIHESPGQFMYREGHYEWRHGNGQHPLASTDRYLDRHPEVAEQLNAHPRLVDDRRYVERHPGLDEFLENHPAARAQWRSHPYRFMRRENRFDRNH